MAKLLLKLKKMFGQTESQVYSILILTLMLENTLSKLSVLRTAVTVRQLGNSVSLEEIGKKLPWKAYNHYKYLKKYQLDLLSNINLLNLTTHLLQKMNTDTYSTNGVMMATAEPI